MSSGRLRLPLTAWVGMVLIFLGLGAYAGVQHWMATRTFVALDQPISLAPGQRSTGEFSINLSELYFVDIRLDEPRLSELPDCQLWDRSGYTLHVRWQLFRSGRLVAQGASGQWGLDLGHFESERGSYNLNLQVLSESGCLNAANPRLRIQTYADYSGVYYTVCWLCALVALAGLGVLARCGLARIVGPSGSHKGSGGLAPGSYLPRGDLPHKNPIATLPAFSLVAAITLFLVLAPYWVLFAWLHNPRSVGLRVYLTEPGVGVAESDSWNKMLIVRVDAAGRWYLNGKQIAPPELLSRLKEALIRRGDRRVFLGGDEDADYYRVVGAMEAIQNTFDASVFLLTPQTKANTAP